MTIRVISELELQLQLDLWYNYVKLQVLTRSCRWSIYRPPDFQLSETHKSKKEQLLGFSFLPDDHYNLNLSSGEKVNP